MEVPFEAAQGISEKLFGVKFPVVMRVVFPGIEATAVLYPTMTWVVEKFPAESESAWLRLAVYAGLVFLLGALISTLHGEIYKIYEGRTLWPDKLFRWARGRQQARVRRLRSAADALETDETRYDELWAQLSIYPVDDQGDPTATHPTLLGNILAGYEQYPDKRYGMDSIFFWPRIWLQMEKEKKEEIDDQWSVADGFLTLSAIGMVGGLWWLVQAAAATLGAMRYPIPLHSAAGSALGALAWLALGYFWYRLSLPFHRENGEIYKSIFDVYRHTVWDLTKLQPEEKERWNAAWAYLQYLLIKCPNCGNMNAPASEQCATCGFGLEELTRHLRKTGKLPT